MYKKLVLANSVRNFKMLLQPKALILLCGIIAVFTTSTKGSQLLTESDANKPLLDATLNYTLKTRCGQLVELNPCLNKDVERDTFRYPCDNRRYVTCLKNKKTFHIRFCSPHKYFTNRGCSKSKN